MSPIFYIICTFIGIFGKLWAFTILKRNWQHSVLHLLTAVFIAIFLLQSTFELMLYYFSEDSAAGHIALIGYYFCAYTFISILPFIIAIITRYKLNQIFTYGIFLVNIIFLFLLIFTKDIIAGIDHTGVSLTRIAGNYYWIFQLTALFSIIYCLYILFRQKNIADGFLKIRTNNILLSFLSIAIFVIFIVVAMQFFENINAVGIQPIFIAVFVMGIVDNICNKHITDYSYWIPFSKKRREINKLIKPFIKIQSDGLDPELKKEYNKLITQHALELFDGNQTKAAEWLNVSQSWVSRNNKHIDD